MRIEISPTEFQVRVYDSDEDEYDIVFKIRKYGHTGIIDSLKSDKRNFYKIFDEIYNKIALECDIIEINAIVLPRHARVIQRVLGKKYKVSILKEEINEGRQMNWMLVGPFT